MLQWDAPHKEKGKNGKFDHLWKVMYNISTFRGNNAYVLEEMEGGLVSGTPVNGRLLKHYFLSKNSVPLSLYIPFPFVLRHNACVDGSLIRFKARGEGSTIFKIHHHLSLFSR